MQIAWPERPLPSAWGAVWGVGSEGRMTSCVGVSWERGKTGGMEPGTDAGKPGGRFWCRAGCPRPVETRHRSDRAEQEPGPWAGTDHHTHQDSCPAPCPTCPQTLTVGMSSHPQGGAAGAGQPGRVGRVGMGGRTPMDSQESSPAPQFKSINSSVVCFLYSPTLTSKHQSDHMDHSLV